MCALNRCSYIKRSQYTNQEMNQSVNVLLNNRNTKNFNAMCVYERVVPSYNGCIYIYIVYYDIWSIDL